MFAQGAISFISGLLDLIQSHPVGTEQRSLLLRAGTSPHFHSRDPLFAQTRCPGSNRPAFHRPIGRDNW